MPELGSYQIVKGIVGLAIIASLQNKHQLHLESLRADPTMFIDSEAIVGTQRPNQGRPPGLNLAFIGHSLVCYMTSFLNGGRKLRD
jgi:hypothetical protein